MEIDFQTHSTLLFEVDSAEPNVINVHTDSLHSEESQLGVGME